MRIIAGTAGGRRIAVPPGRTTRPTADRVREAMFASLLSELGAFSGLRVLDLYAGSGALGLEALSRGAAAALMVESDRRAVAVLRRNIGDLALPGAEVAADRVERVVARPPAGGPCDLLLADPPYALPGSGLGEVLESARECGWLAEDAPVVVERSSHGEELRWPPGYLPSRARRYGDVTLWYGRAR